MGEILKWVWIGFWTAAGWWLFATAIGFKILASFCFTIAGKETPDDHLN